jgi:hypothetical protein
MHPFHARWCLPAIFVMTAAAAEPDPAPPVAAETVVQAVERPFKKELLEGSGSTADDASLLLVFLGAGYDHTTPNKYRGALAVGLRRISTLDPASLDLPVLALATSALAEAYAMTSDPLLRPHTDRFLGDLRTRWPGELPRWLGRTGAFAGPEALALVVQAIQSCQAGGLAVGDDVKALQAIDLGQGEAAELAGAYRKACSASKPPFVDFATTQRWVASFDRWWKAGQTELILMAAFVALRNGGREWQLLNDSWRERIIALQIHGGSDDGRWPLEHHPLGKLYGTIQMMRCLEFSFRAVPAEGVKPAPAGTPPDTGGF